MRSSDKSEGLEMLNPSLIKRLIEDAVSAAILLGLCVLIVRAPVRATSDAPATPSVIQVDPSPGNSADSDIDSVHVTATQGEPIALAD